MLTKSTSSVFKTYIFSFKLIVYFIGNTFVVLKHGYVEEHEESHHAVLSNLSFAEV